MPTGTYVYCLIAAARVPALKRSTRGLPGVGPVRLLAVEEARKSPGSLKQWLAVADAPSALYGEEAINTHLSDLDWVARAAIAHERVVESFIEQPAIVPMKLFTIFNSDARALEHVRAERRRVSAVIARVKGQHEWGVRLALDATRGSKNQARKSASPVTSGAAYLSLKKTHRDRAAELAGRAHETVAGLYDRLDRQASAAKRRSASELPVKGGPLLLDAAFLVPRTRSARFQNLVARESRALASQGYLVTLSGPWPPYSFLQD